jgi:uncharacterized membrane protein
MQGSWYRRSLLMRLLLKGIEKYWKKYDKMKTKNYLLIIIPILLITDLVILLDIPFLRQILGFLFLTILPGLLILQILKLNKIGTTEKFVLSVGLSISFLMFFGLLINNLSLSLGYETPLLTIPLLFSFNIAFIVLAVAGYKINKNPIFSLPNLNLNTSEKAFLIAPIMFPALSIFGMHIMNTTDNNIILIFLLFLIPIYVVFVCFFNQRFSKRFYPIMIFLISISLLLLLSLRSNHIIGIDTHFEYYYFQTTLCNLYWSVWGHSQLDACLSISLLPTIYQSTLNVSSEFLFRILYSLIYSISPLVIYVISKKYVGEGYAFLASCFFMFQFNFLFTEYNARTNTAILFFALAMMVLFNDKIDPLKKRILFIVFMASCMVSHYSTTYIFFFIMLGTFIGMEILSKKYSFKKVVSLTITILFFALIFFWYSQVTETAFNAGVGFVEETFSNLNRFFIEESREEQFKQLVGQELAYPILSRASWVVTWCTFIFIGIGVLTMLKRYKEMVAISNVKLKKPDFLKTKFEMEYLVMTLACAGLLVIMLALPFVSVGYGIQRLYSFVIVILSVCFIIGGITLSKQTFRKSLIKNAVQKPFLRKKSFTKNLSLKKKALPKKEKEGEKGEIWEGKGNGSQVRAYLVILLILIPYSMFVTGAMYQIFGAPVSIILNSEGEQYEMYYTHDQESYGAKWLKEYGDSKTRVYTDFYGRFGLISQACFPPKSIDWYHLACHEKIDGYIYLRYYNVVNDKIVGRNESSRILTSYNLTEYDDVFIKKDKIYNNGGLEVYR